MKPTFLHTCIIFNPNSTSGEAKTKAKTLSKELAAHGFLPELIETKRAGHGEEIAYNFAAKYRQPLIVSVSGDGGYNDIINGVMRAADEGKAHDPVCALSAAGNANDHRRAIRKRPLLEGILAGQPEAIDILKLEALAENFTLSRYAHSYIGFGLTSKGAYELNKEHLNRIRELEVVFRTLLHFETLIIESPQGKREKLDSLVFSNINTMSKVLKMGEKTNLHNGTFKIVAIPHYNRLRLFGELAAIAVFGFKNIPQSKKFRFKIINHELVHLDGEVTKIPKQSTVTITCASKALLTIR